MNNKDLPVKSTLSVKEVAQYLGISKDTVYSLVREDSIPFVRIGRRILFKKDTVDHWFLSKERKCYYVEN